METPASENGASRLANTPVLLCADMISEVLSRPDNPVDWFKQLFSQNEEAIPERG